MGVTLEEIMLEDAVRSGDVTKTAALLKEHEGLRVKQHEDNSLFPMCLRNHEREMVKIFLTEDSSLAEKIHYTQAHHYAETGDLPALDNLLKAEPALLNATDSYGNTPLHLAATQGNVDMVQYLNHKGSSLTALNADQNSPLQLALLFDKHPEKNMAKYLVNQLGLDKDLNISFLLNSAEKNAADINNQNQNTELKLVTQEIWNNLVESKLNSYMYGYVENPNEVKKIADILSGEGYAPFLQNLTIHAHNMKHVDFAGMSFDQCTFKGAFSEVKFSEGLISNSQFDHAYFNQAFFAAGLNFNHTSFTDTYFKDTVFYQNQFQNSLFSHTSFDGTFIGEADFDTVFVSHSNLLGATIYNTEKMQIVMDNTVFKPETVEAFSQNIQFLNTDAPVIGLISSPHEIIYGGEVGMTGADPYARLKQYGATPVLLDMNNVQESIDYEKLPQEIKSIVQSVPAGVNIPKYLLSQKAENIDKIKAMANEYAKHLDALWIPGGPDVHPAFYGQENKGAHESDYSYAREIFEFALIDHMVTHDKPLMGICHGSQITNVYFGGTLIQHLQGHHDDHLVVPLQDQTNYKDYTPGVVSQILHEPTIGVSNHHQAIDKIGEGLQVVAMSGPVVENFIVNNNTAIETIIEASEGVDGKPVMLFQFHPEYNLDNTNRDILMQFVDLAKKSREAHMLEVKDVLMPEPMIVGDIMPPSAPVFIPTAGLENLFAHHAESVQLG
jgi:gamma-glutamyl-gamma-aminobutyrate hydrolase PuuD/uncharacterized protein YjbI with pentapeptide repeats